LSTRAVRRPGLRFEAQAPPSPVVLPRMDVACFVGYAAGGPFQVPVPVEDPEQYAAIFGDDVALAVEPGTGEPAYAQLGPAVRGFLREGGRRCWVVRAGEPDAAEAPAFVVPGLWRLRGGDAEPARLRARSPGTWADDVQVGACIQVEPLEVLGTTPLRLRAPLAAGDLVRVCEGGWTHYLAATAADDGSTLLDLGRAVWTEPPASPPHSPPAAGLRAERITLELWTRRGQQPPNRLAALGFAAGHPRWVGLLPSDARRYAPDPESPAFPAPFPLCGDDLEPGDVLLPLSLRTFPERFASAETPAAAPLARNGIPADEPDPVTLAERTLWAFVEPELGRLATLALAAAVDHRRALDGTVIPRGVHAVMELDEVTLLAIPDAAQRPSMTVAAEPLPPVTAPTGVPHPDPADFERCSLRRLADITLSVDGPAPSGVARLHWTPTDDPQAHYLVQASADPKEFAGAETLFDGPETELVVDAGRIGPYVRVRAYSASGDSDWSNGLALDAGPRVRTTLIEPGDYRSDALIAIQRAALRACGARGDVMTVLSMPGHFREDDALAHVATLRPAGRRPTALDSLVPPLDQSENAALAHGALYHPWPTVLLDGGPELRRIVPDGAAAGVIAGRARERGAWIAPAGDPLRDVVALEPALERARALELLEAHLNTLTQEPAGFVCLAEETLSLDDDQREINVRRLLDLLRRLALLHGPEYVFAINDARLRRRVQRGFERVLTVLHARGALAGRTTAEAFRVDVSAPQGGDLGRLIVELRVAPSLPMRFLTIRLVHGAGGVVEVQG
jgi:hypothetical protein